MGASPPDAHETSRLSGTVSAGARWRVSGFRAKVASKQLYPKAIVIQIWVCWLLPIANVGPERLEAIVSRTKQVSRRKRRCKIGPILGAAGLSLSLAGGVSAATAAPVADALTQNSVVSHEITLDEEEIADVNLATFYVFDKENAGPSRHGVRLACGCWTGTYYTSGNDAYAPSPRPLGHAIAPKRVSKTPQQARPGSTTHLALRKTSR